MIERDVRTIRRARIDDAERVYEIYCGFLNREVNEHAKYTLESFQYYIDSDHVNVDVYEINGLIVGFILTFDMVDWGLIEVVSVHPKHRRRGIATTLIEHVVAHPKPLWFVIETCYNLTDIGVDVVFAKTGFQQSSQRTEWVYRLPQSKDN